MGKKAGVFKSTAWYGAGNLILRAVNFLLLPLYSQVLSTEEFGNYALILAFYSLGLVVYQLGFSAGFTKFYIDEEDEEKQKNVLSSILNTIFILTFLFSIIGILFSSNISQLILSTNQYSDLITITILTMFFENLSFYLLFYFKILEKSKYVVFIVTIAAILNFSLNIILVYFLKFGISGILLSQLFSSILVVIILIPKIFSKYKFVLQTPFIKKLFLFALPLFIGGIFTILLEVIDRYFIDYYLSKSDVGIYSFSYRIAIVMNLFVISFRTAWIPSALKSYKKGNYSDHFGNIFTKFVALLLLILFTVSIFAGDLFNFQIFGNYIFNPIYKSGIVIIPLVLLGYLFNGFGGFYSIYPLVTEKSKHFLFSDALALIVNIILNILLIKKYGIIGAAFATTMGLLVTAAYLWIVSKNKIKVNYQKKEITIVGIATVICFYSAYYFNNIFVDIFLLLVFLIILKFTLGFGLKRILNFIKSP